MSQDPVTSTQDLSTVRERRASLRRACQDLEGVLAAPLSGDSGATWVKDVATALTGLRHTFDAHVSATEGPGGLFEQIRADAPRLEGTLLGLRREHERLGNALATADERLQAGDLPAMERARELLSGALTMLSRHRRRGADLLYQAYQVDIGGE